MFYGNLSRRYIFNYNTITSSLLVYIKCMCLFFGFIGSGLQLFIAKDGTTTLGSQDVKCHMSNSLFKQVVMEDNR